VRNEPVEVSLLVIDALDALDVPYFIGGEVSDRQWNDVQNVLQVQRDRLEIDYLYHWATQLGVPDLLKRALTEAGLD